MKAKNNVTVTGVTVIVHIYNRDRQYLMAFSFATLKFIFFQAKLGKAANKRSEAPRSVVKSPKTRGEKRAANNM